MKKEKLNTQYLRGKHLTNKEKNHVRKQLKPYTKKNFFFSEFFLSPLPIGYDFGVG